MANTPHKATTSGFDPERFVPRPNPLAACYDRGQDEERGRYVLLRSDGGDSVALSDEDHQIWELIDGKRTVSEISRVYLERHRRIALTRIYSLVRALLAAAIIAPQDGNAANIIQRPIWERLNLANVSIASVPGTTALTAAVAKLLKTVKPSAAPLHILLLIPALIGGFVAMLPGGPVTPPPLWLSTPITTPLGTAPVGFTSAIILLLIMNLVVSFLRELWRGPPDHQSLCPG